MENAEDKENGGNSGNSGNSGNTGKNEVKITKKLEEEYQARIEAYQAYFDEIRGKYSEYEFQATVRLDSKGLPLMWLLLKDPNSNNSKDRYRTQLVGYEGKKTAVLAERKEYIYPYGGGQLIMGETDRDIVYLYDEEKKDFVDVTDKFEGPEDVDNTIYSKDELSEKAEALSKMLECKDFFNIVEIAYNQNNQIAYLGKNRLDDDYYCQALINLKVLFPYIYYEDVESHSYRILDICFLRKEYAANRNVLNYFEQLADADLDKLLNEDEKKRLLRLLGDEEEMSFSYNKMMKEVPGKAWVLPDGTTYTGEDAENYQNRVYIFKNSVGDVSYGIEGAYEYFKEIDAERILRELQKKPIYSQAELLLCLVSVYKDFETTEVDLSDYTLSKASNSFIADVILQYFRKDYDRVKYFFTDELIANHASLMGTEPYRTIKGIIKVDFQNNIATLYCRDGSEYQFQIEFHKSGEKISKITYIDPYASLPEWKKAYLNELDFSGDTMYFYFGDINADGIPEISDDWNLYYIDKSNTVQELYDEEGYFRYNEEKIYISGGSQGYYYDNVYLRNKETGVYEQIFHGYWEMPEMEVTYNSINGTEVSEEEYYAKLKEVTAGIEDSIYRDYQPITDLKSMIIDY